MKFVKMQAVGNDYIYVDFNQVLGQDLSALAKNLSRRRFSVGSDGIITVQKIDCERIKMRIFNADGSEGKTCGNGVRCSAVFARKYLGVTSSAVKVLTRSNLATVNVLTKPPFEVSLKSKATFASADMCDCVCENADYLCENFQKVGLYVDKRQVYTVNTGNEHLVVFTKDELEKIVDGVKSSGRFLDGVNIEKVFAVESKNNGLFRLNVEIFERGSGKTLSCGSGAVAIARAFAKKENIIDSNAVFEIVSSGGSLFVTFDGDRATLWGEVVEVFRGEIDLN
ncbi:MAG: diaminopimelate epimerase [Clostridia bacterium]|nr:diaminopimelate epimerase [Clostridia bacterium]